jgi:hypothetical protein
MSWKPCVDGRCNGVVRKHDRDGRCEECGHAPPKAEPAPACAETMSLFGEPAEAPAQRHSPTSVAAAEAIAPKLPEKRRNLLLHIFAHWSDGATDNELLADLVGIGWSVNGVRPRRIELVQGGWLEQVGERAGCAVWAPSEEAVRWHAAVRRGRAA